MRVKRGGHRVHSFMSKRYPLLKYTQVQVKVLQSDVYLRKVLKYLFLKVLEYQEYKSTFSKYCITTVFVLTFMNIKLPT